MKKTWVNKCFNIFQHPRSFWVSSVIQMVLESAVKMGTYYTSSVLRPKFRPLCWEKAFCCSITHSCLILWDPMDCRMPGLPVLHHLLEFTQTHVHWVGNAIHLILYCPLLLLPLIFFSITVFSNELVLHITCSNYWALASASALAKNIQDRFPLGMTGLIFL